MLTLILGFITGLAICNALRASPSNYAIAYEGLDMRAEIRRRLRMHGAQLRRLREHGMTLEDVGVDPEIAQEAEGLVAYPAEVINCDRPFQLPPEARELNRQFPKSAAWRTSVYRKEFETQCALRRGETQALVPTTPPNFRNSNQTNVHTHFPIENIQTIPPSLSEFARAYLTTEEQEIQDIKRICRDKGKKCVVSLLDANKVRKNRRKHRTNGKPIPFILAPEGGFAPGSDTFGRPVVPFFNPPPGNLTMAPETTHILQQDIAGT